MHIDANKALKSLSPTKVLLPALLGLGVTIYLFASTYTWEELSFIFRAEVGLVIASFAVLIIRDAGYVYRLRHLTSKQLSWVSSIYSIILWEFASAITPSAVGGTAIATFILFKEGLSFGKSLAYVMVSAVLDNSFFLLFGLLSLIAFGADIFPVIPLEIFGVQADNGVKAIFFISYILIGLYTLLMAYALLVRPRAFKWFLLWFTSFGWSRRWRASANLQGNEMILASAELRGKGSGYWIKASVITIVIWSARYLMLNCLMAAFVDATFADHLLIFGRQVIMWVVLLLSFTPGAAGLAEIAFPSFYQQFLGSYSEAVGIFWRMFTYYPYLMLGALILPRWIRRVFFHKGKKK